MLFITNRAFKEGTTTSVGRRVRFALDDNSAQHSMYFCNRTAKGRYSEIGSKAFLARLKTAEARQILIYIHGYSNLPGCEYEQFQVVLRVSMGVFVALNDHDPEHRAVRAPQRGTRPALRSRPEDPFDLPLPDPAAVLGGVTSPNPRMSSRVTPQRGAALIRQK